MLIQGKLLQGFSWAFLADGNGNSRHCDDEYGASDQHHQGAATAITAGLSIHYLHPRLLREGVQATAVFRGDLHGSNAIGRTL